MCNAAPRGRATQESRMSGGPRDAGRRAMASGGTRGPGRVNQPGGGSGISPMPRGGVAKTVRMRACIPPVEKSTRSEETRAPGVSACIASRSRMGEGEGASRHSPTREMATQGSTAIATSRTPRWCLLTRVVIGSAGRGDGWKAKRNPKEADQAIGGQPCRPPLPTRPPSAPQPRISNPKRPE